MRATRSPNAASQLVVAGPGVLEHVVEQRRDNNVDVAALDRGD